MNTFRCRVSLKFRHPTLRVDRISDGLGMVPRISWTAGEKRITPNGDPLPGVRQDTYWCSEAFEVDGPMLGAALHHHLLDLELRRHFLEEFVLTGGKIEYFVGWFSEDSNTGVTLDWTLCKRLADLHIDLGLDVYAAEIRQQYKESPDGK